MDSDYVVQLERMDTSLWRATLQVDGVHVTGCGKDISTALRDLANLFEDITEHPEKTWDHE